MRQVATRTASSASACSSSTSVPTVSFRTSQRSRQPQRQARGVVVQAADAMCRDMVGERKEVKTQGKVFKLKFLASGGEFREAECPDNMYILDAAEQAGIDLPATCRGGICGACVARVSKGSVDASDIPDLEFTVSADEQAAGMALLCMTRATADCEIETQSDWGYSLGVGDWKGASGKFTSKPEALMGGEWKAGQKK